MVDVFSKRFLLMFWISQPYFVLIDLKLAKLIKKNTALDFCNFSVDLVRSYLRYVIGILMDFKKILVPYVMSEKERQFQNKQISLGNCVDLILRASSTNQS